MSSHRLLCSSSSFLALSALLGLACQSSSTQCEDHGGITVDGLCKCPAGTTLKDNDCQDAGSGATGSDARVDSLDPDGGANSHPGDHGESHDASYDGASDASDPATKGDGGAGPAPNDDAGTTTVDANVPDAGVADAGFICAPTGTWKVTRQYESGSCTTPLADFETSMHGHLADNFEGESSCSLTDQNESADLCRFRYTEDCSGSPGTVGREIGDLRFVSADRIEGTQLTMFFDESAKTATNPTGQTCSGTISLIGTRER